MLRCLVFKVSLKENDHLNAKSFVTTDTYIQLDGLKDISFIKVNPVYSIVCKLKSIFTSKFIISNETKKFIVDISINDDNRYQIKLDPIDIKDTLDINLLLLCDVISAKTDACAPTIKIRKYRILKCFVIDDERFVPIDKKCLIITID